MGLDLGPESFFDLEGLDSCGEVSRLFREFFEVRYVWEVLGGRLEGFLGTLVEGCRIHSLVPEGVHLLGDRIYIGEEVVLEPGVVIQAPAWVGRGVVLRSHAYVRGCSLLMEGSLVGHATEVKGSVLLPGAQAPHFNYVGDSVLGRGVNLGAGCVLSNLKNLSSSEVILRIEGREFATGLRKFGSILGDGVKTGCNSVLHPGVLMGRGGVVYPNVSLRKGYYPPGSLVKLRQVLEVELVRGDG